MKIEKLSSGNIIIFNTDGSIFTSLPKQGLFVHPTPDETKSILISLNPSKYERSETTKIEDYTTITELVVAGQVVPFSGTRDELIIMLQTNFFKGGDNGSGVVSDSVKAYVNSEIAKKTKGKKERAGVFNANVSSQLYPLPGEPVVPNEPIVIWDASVKQLKYTLNNYHWFDISILKIDGNSAITRQTSDDISSSNGTFFGTTSGSRNVAFDHENYGATTHSALIRENHSKTHAAARVFIQTGNTSSGSFIVEIINPQS